MNLELTTWQRLQLLLLVSRVQGDLRTINKALKLIDILEFTGEEQAEIGLSQTPNGFAWQNPEKRWIIEIKDPDLAAFLKDKVQTKTDWPTHRDVIDLCKQLSIDLDKE